MGVITYLARSMSRGQTRALIYLALATALFIVGWQAQGWRLNARINQLKAQHAQAVTDAIADETARAQAAATITKELYEQDIQRTAARAHTMRAGHRAGTHSLSIPIQACTQHAGNASSAGASPESAHAEIRAQLSDEAATFFIAEAERADNDGARLNALIDFVEQLKTGQNDNLSAGATQ